MTGVGGMFYVRSYFKEKEVKYTQKQRNIFIAVTVVFFAAAAVLMAVFSNPDDRTLFVFAKTLLVCFSYYFLAVIDFKLKVIPNKALLVMLGVVVILLAAQCLVEGRSIMILSDALIGSVIAGGIFMIGKLISRNGMGMGDVKLMAVSGLYVGLNEVMGIIFWALFCAMLTGFGLMIAKKAKIKSTIPLAPFFFLGSVISNVFYIISGLTEG